MGKLILEELSMRYATLAAALIAATQAVKTSNGQVQAQDFTMEGLIGGAENWYTTVAKPFLDANRDQVAMQAQLSAEEQYGVLLSEAGTQCRIENRRVIEEAIKAEWMKVLLSFRTDVDATILKTRKIIKTGYETAVVCETENPCCTVSEVVYNNIRVQINTTETLIRTKWTQWEELERRRIEIETECPMVDFTVVYGEYRTYDVTASASFSASVTL